MEETIDKEFLNKIINKFANNGKVFVNEAQFQFDLAMALQQKLGKGYNVQFEVLSINKEDINEFFDTKKEEREKLYTDLIIEEPNGNCIAIELKYKTAQPASKRYFRYTTNCKNIKKETYVFPQGAVDNGSYDFLWDLYRIERLVDGKIKYNFSDKKVEKGFAIILTNESKYTSGFEGGDRHFENFFLRNGEMIIGKRWWNDNGTNVECIEDKVNQKNKRYSKSIDLKGSYPIKWETYNLPDGTECECYPAYKRKKLNKKDFNFRYLILEYPN